VPFRAYVACHAELLQSAKPKLLLLKVGRFLRVPGT
jgi:hypothetical protein